MSGKTEMTLEVEEALRKRARSESKRYAFEVPVPNGICDFVTTKLDYRNCKIPHITCYEIKTSFNDFFYSKNGANFIGDENYYVVPSELWKEIVSKDAQVKIPSGVGLIFYYQDKKQLRKKTDGKNNLCKLGISDKFQIMDNMLMRSLYEPTETKHE